MTTVEVATLPVSSRKKSWSRRPSEQAWSERLNRGLDITLALMALIFLAPLLILIAIMIRGTDGKTALFAQSRMGRGGQTFECFKFRTMVTDADARLTSLLARDPVARAEWDIDHKLRNDPRITPVGRFLRKSSLDELPQLINVLRGDMSLVGPRPIVVGEIVRYKSYYRHYCSMRPGITGLWQVSGRNNVSYRRRVACDVLYSRRRSVGVNVRIMAATIPAVAMAKGSF